ncbi:hypothetical protein QBC34DRAFT_384698 [Podospora aff. communis PSN243]|uniref:Uncharacterized protein n=1 Tax=Podospora aff. communis PSN243 TaxID=3040156 RepID=A0AAV9GAX5_9PEZI|nr:hypothetical protein QBC34DRAFT_384698 [Podospora aff. communis PSN243]
MRQLLVNNGGRASPRGKDTNSQPLLYTDAKPEASLSTSLEMEGPEDEDSPEENAVLALALLQHEIMILLIVAAIIVALLATLLVLPELLFSHSPVGWSSHNSIPPLFPTSTTTVTVTATPSTTSTATQTSQPSQANPFLWKASRIDVIFSHHGDSQCKWDLAIPQNVGIASGEFYCVHCLCDETLERLLYVERRTYFGEVMEIPRTTIGCGQYLCLGITETLDSQLPLSLVAPPHQRFKLGDWLEVFDH